MECRKCDSVILVENVCVQINYCLGYPKEKIEGQPRSQGLFPGLAREKALGTRLIEGESAHRVINYCQAFV